MINNQFKHFAILWAQSFTPLQADLWLNITRGFLLVGVLMKYLPERNPPSLTHKRIFVFSTLLIRDNWRFQINRSGNIPLWHLLKEETMFMSWRKFIFMEVNDWAPKRKLHQTKIIVRFHLLFQFFDSLCQKHGPKSIVNVSNLFYTNQHIQGSKCNRLEISWKQST